MNLNYPIQDVRAQFPSLQRMHLGKPAVYFDGPGGSQTLGSAIKAMSDYLQNGVANIHGYSPTSHETEAILAKAREDLAVLFQAKPTEIAFGPNATSLMFAVARALSKTWEPGDEIILSELDHHAHVDSWLTAAQDHAVTVKWIPVDTQRLTLDLSALSSLIGPKTKLVAIGAASNCIGTITDITEVARLAKTVGALVSVDAVHAIPHIPLDMQNMNLDFIFTSAYKCFAAHVGMAAIREDIFQSLPIYKVAPAPDYYPDILEMGTQNYEGLATIPCTVDFFANLGTGDDLRSKLISGYAQIEAHENHLANIIRTEFAKIPEITLYQADDTTPKTPTIAFRIAGITNEDFCTRMCAEYSIFISSGDFYAKTLMEKLGIRASGSIIRAGLAPYNTTEEVERFIQATREIIASHSSDN